METMHEQSIPEFFKGKNIFMTGATGFMGKVLLEKFLRSCPEIGTIYILLRPKKGRDLNERLEELLKQKVFDLVREQSSGLLEKKIVPLAGDVNNLNLGLSEEDRQKIINEVNIIYHVAASVRFDDPLKDAIILNVRGTREVCQLALETKNLVIFVHTSTAFANCDRFEAFETLYAPKADWRKTIELAEKCDRETLNILTQKYLTKMPNTYTFTKSIAEHIVVDMCKGKIPVKICRPSIVISALEEPFRGWIDNFNGPAGLLIACGKGLIRSHYVSLENRPDYIPVDICIKAMIVATWDLGLRQNKTEPEILHCTSFNIEWSRPTIKRLSETCMDVIQEIPLNDVIWMPSTYYSTSLTVWYIRVIILQLIPALFMDLMLQLSGKQPLLTRLQKRLYGANMALRYFIRNDWKYCNKNFLELHKNILPNDLDKFTYVYDDVDFYESVKYNILGARRYLLNEQDDTLPKARRHYRKMMWIDRIFTAFFYLIIFFIVWKLDFFNMAIAKVDRIFNFISREEAAAANIL